MGSPGIRRRVVLILLLLLVTVLLAGCGQKGGLYLPDDATPEQHQ